MGPTVAPSLGVAVLHPGGARVNRLGQWPWRGSAARVSSRQGRCTMLSARAGRGALAPSVRPLAWCSMFALLTSTGVVTISEIGDRTQLLAFLVPAASDHPRHLCRHRAEPHRRGARGRVGRVGSWTRRGGGCWRPARPCRCRRRLGYSAEGKPEVIVEACAAPGLLAFIVC